MTPVHIETMLAFWYPGQKAFKPLTAEEVSRRTGQTYHHGLPPPTCQALVAQGLLHSRSLSGCRLWWPSRLGEEWIRAHLEMVDKGKKVALIAK